MNKEDYIKYYIQGSDHYLIPKDVFIELFSEMENWREEVKELKKQLEEYKYSHSCSFADTCKNVKIANYNQQKEFIEYLENEININPYNISDYTYEDIINTILSKYKEIIGSDINVGSIGGKE